MRASNKFRDTFYGTYWCLRLLSATCLYKLMTFYCRLILEPDITYHSFKFKHIQSHTTQYKHSFFCQNSTWVELSFWSLRQRGYHHRIPDAAPLRALSGVHNPHRRDTRKWSDDYRTRTRTRATVEPTAAFSRRYKTMVQQSNSNNMWWVCRRSADLGVTVV